MTTVFVKQPLASPGSTKSNIINKVTIKNTWGNAENKLVYHLPHELAQYSIISPLGPPKLLLYIPPFISRPTGLDKGCSTNTIAIC